MNKQILDGCTAAAHVKTATSKTPLYKTLQINSIREIGP